MDAVEWLKEQITFDADGERWTNFIDCYDLSGFFNKAKGLEQEQKDNFAIGFAEWLSDNCTEIHKVGEHKGKYYLLQKAEFYTIQELLQIYKSQL
jgi:hypothetical protein